MSEGVQRLTEFVSIIKRDLSSQSARNRNDTTTRATWPSCMGRVIFLLLIAAVACTLMASPAIAQEEDVEEEAAPAPAEGDMGTMPAADSHYIAVGWLVFLTLGIGLWIVLLGFVNQDSAVLRMNQKMWNTIAFITGLFFFSLALVVHGAFIILGIIGVITIGVVYVILRNKTVREEQRIFTQKHLSKVFWRAMWKIGIKRQIETSGGGGERDEPQIVLMRKDGRTIEAVSEQATNEPSEAVYTLKQVLESAIRSRATDIHIEPGEKDLIIRFRVDGVLHALPAYPSELGPPVVSVAKVLADMDISERRRPQDGAFSGSLDGRSLDFRVATSGTVHGETMSIRILDRNRDLIGLEELGMNQKMVERFRKVINAPHGMIIVAGPTGAGKTTTLYAALQEMDVYQKNIMTIEDPIEYRLDNIQQMAVNPKSGITFASALRSLLRQDPNVIMVGEIRDAETARVALQAAMTGHLVMTTIHANDSVVSLFRLLDLGVEPYLIASSLSCIVSQRLVRVLCEQCKVPYQPKPEFLAKFGIKSTPENPHYLYKAQGCEVCQGTGYYGRVGIFEMLIMTDSIREMVREKPSVQQVRAEAKKSGLRSLQDEGMIKVIKGITSIKELTRVTK